MTTQLTHTTADRASRKRAGLFCAFLFLLVAGSVEVSATELTNSLLNQSSRLISLRPDSWFYGYRVIITAILFVLAAFTTLMLAVLDVRLRKKVLKQFLRSYGETAETVLSANQPISNIIELTRIAFVVSLTLLFFFVLFTYQTYSNQAIAMMMATGIFALNVFGSYLFGSLKRSRQIERLADRVQLQTHNRKIANEKFRQVEQRALAQYSCLANLASSQLKQRRSQEDFFKQIITQSSTTLAVNRVSIWLFSEDEQSLKCISMYQQDTQQYTSGANLAAEKLPDYFKALSEDRVLAIDDAYNHPATVGFVTDYLPQNKIGAMLDATIWDNEKVVGVLCHEHLGGPREWTIDEQNFVGSLADLVRLTLESGKRQQIEIDLMHQQTYMDTLVKSRTAAIERNANLFRFLVERAPVSILYMNAANEILEMNPEAERVSGYQREFAIGKTYQSLFCSADDPALQERHEAINRKVAYGEKIQGEELTIRCADGNLLDLSISRSMEVDADGNPMIISIGQDITKQKALEASLIQAREAAESADRIKSMFVASMSHELRTPLNSIIGFLGVVLQGMSGEINIKQKDQLNRAYQSARHLLSLISDVIDISKIEAGFLQVFAESFELRPLLSEVQQAVQHLVDDKHLTLNIDCAADIILETDKKRLYQVILNIVSNAVKYTEQGTVEIDVLRDADWIAIRVEDTGIGIDKNGLEKLFKPFERVESRLKIKTLGTGLGLYLSKNIVTQLLGGDITVESRLEVGSTFTVKIPLKMPKIDRQKISSILDVPN